MIGAGGEREGRLNRDGRPGRDRQVRDDVLEHPFVRRMVRPAGGHGVDQREEQLGRGRRQIRRAVRKGRDPGELVVERLLAPEQLGDGGLVDRLRRDEREEDRDVRRCAERCARIVRESQRRDELLGFGNLDDQRGAAWHARQREAGGADRQSVLDPGDR